MPWVSLLPFSCMRILIISPEPENNLKDDITIVESENLTHFQYTCTGILNLLLSNDVSKF